MLQTFLSGEEWNCGHFGRMGRQVVPSLAFFLFFIFDLCRFCILLQGGFAVMSKRFQITYPFVNTMLLIFPLNLGVMAVGSKEPGVF